MHVHAVGVERDDPPARTLPVVDRDQHEVDVGLRPDRVVRQAAAEDRGEDGAIVLHLLHEGVERSGEALSNRRGRRVAGNAC